MYISPFVHDVGLRFQALAAVAWLGFQALAAAADTLLAASDDAHLACTVVAALPVCVAISWSRNVVDRMSCCSLLLKANGMATAMLRLVALDAAVVPSSTFMRVHKPPTSSDVYSLWGRQPRCVNTFVCCDLAGSNHVLTHLCVASSTPATTSLLRHMRRKGEN